MLKSQEGVADKAVNGYSEMSSMVDCAVFWESLVERKNHNTRKLIY